LTTRTPKCPSFGTGSSPQSPPGHRDVLC
jgi:hypothetical protein